MKTLAVIPVYNEEKTISDIIRKTKTYVDDVLVIDDNSNDDSFMESFRAGAIVSRKVLNRKGKGESLKLGFQKAVEDNYDVVIILDGDGEHDPEEIPLLLDKLKDNDIVIGQRKNYRSWLRIILNEISTFTFRFLIHDINDVWCGFRAIKVDFLRQLEFRSTGFEIEMELLMDAVRMHKKIGFVDISTVPTEKTHFKVVDYIEANNFFSQWVIDNHKQLPNPKLKRTVLLGIAYISLVAGRIIDGPLWRLTNYLIQREERGKTA